MKFKNFSLKKVVYFEDEEGNDYRASSIDNIERRYGESWEGEYNLENNKQLKEDILKSLSKTQGVQLNKMEDKNENWNKRFFVWGR